MKYLLIIPLALLLTSCGDDQCAKEGDLCWTSWDCCVELKCRSSISFEGGWFEIYSRCIPRAE